MIILGIESLGFKDDLDLADQFLHSPRFATRAPSRDMFSSLDSRGDRHIETKSFPAGQASIDVDHGNTGEATILNIERKTADSRTKTDIATFAQFFLWVSVYAYVPAKKTITPMKT